MTFNIIEQTTQLNIDDCNSIELVASTTPSIIINIDEIAEELYLHNNTVILSIMEE